jgi:hypothetical protein
LLTESELDVAINNAANAKRLQRHLITSFTSGYIPPGILSYVISYSGPANISTVHGWLMRSEAARGLNQQQLPPDALRRQQILSESVEGIFCLGLGSIIFDNGAPISMVNDQMRGANPAAKRQVISAADGNLLWLFLLLTQAAANVVGQWGDLVPYLQRYSSNVCFEL